MESPHIMGILNVTPDSFYDGGTYTGIDQAVSRAAAMARDGADIIDIGGESTGPGAKEVSAEEEAKRVMPVVEAMGNEHLAVDICIDTYKAEIAKRALDAGVRMINDVSAGRRDPAMFGVIAAAGCPYIMMHSKDPTPHTKISVVRYDDVIETIHAFFEDRIGAALAAGIQKKQLILDPGLGHFVSSDPRYSWDILERLESLADFGCPILVSPSRKSFTAREGEPPSERLPGTLEATHAAIVHGASIIRTHDVEPTAALVRRCAIGDRV